MKQAHPTADVVRTLPTSGGWIRAGPDKSLDLPGASAPGGGVERYPAVDRTITDISTRLDDSLDHLHRGVVCRQKEQAHPIDAGVVNVVQPPLQEPVEHVYFPLSNQKFVAKQEGWSTDC